ncbi:protein of unknown function [Pseudodesulfovibrio piezophilus C1TLV30]|uniref:Uncharacterized protein n=1 Tax=Pseudodesulfovibrio piezophilus (strain DSM 21447 / JCM 15486 / C1TLV30) TaxID=1322246 RepID=M1WNQ6_PSEP2|nr:protein of unknown function [Pseudodesulfovibrio piezophilus C1TLV30]
MPWVPDKEWDEDREEVPGKDNAVMPDKAWGRDKGKAWDKAIANATELLAPVSHKELQMAPLRRLQSPVKDRALMTRSIPALGGPEGL